MADNKVIHYIPPLPPKREKCVGIYCRVSTNSADQLKSLTAQDINEELKQIEEESKAPEDDFLKQNEEDLEEAGD